MSSTLYQRPERLLKILLVWTSVTTLLFWLPTVRGAFDGASYEWGVLGFSGSGVDASYWFPLLGSVLAIATLWLGWRGARPPFHWLLGGWHSFLAVGITAVVLQDPGGFRLQGDTMGMDIDLAAIGPLFFGGWALLVWCWIVHDFRRKPIRGNLRWTKRNTRWLLALVVLLPLQFVLLRGGDPKSLTDQVGVLLTVGQWLLLGMAFAPSRAQPGGTGIS